MYNQIRFETSSHRVVFLLVFVLALICLPNALFASETTNRKASDGLRVELFELRSDAVDEMVAMSVLLPFDFDHERNGKLPLVIWLHGGGGDRHQLVQLKRHIDAFFDESVIPPMVFASFSSSAFSGFLGPWEEFIKDELPAAMASRYQTRTDRNGILIGGISMGGYGALKSAFRDPTRFLAVGAMEPSIEPTLTELPNFKRNTWTRGPAPALKPSDNPARQVHDNAAAIRNSNLNIYLECGDEDYLNLHDGAEFLHRVLWDNDIRHEYHLVRWADHVGGSMTSRLREMLAFFAQSLAGGRADPVSLPINEVEQQLLTEVVQSAARGESPPPEFGEYLYGLRGPTLHAHAWASLKALANQDPAIKRNYAELPSTSLSEESE